MKDKVYNYKTQYEYGFTDDEMLELLKEYPSINMEKFNNALYGNTCMRIDDKIITYHCDVYKALCCGLENRDLTAEEWD